VGGTAESDRQNLRLGGTIPKAARSPTKLLSKQNNALRIARHQSESEEDAHMPEDNLARKSFENAREAMDRATAGAEQATRQAEQSYSFAAEGIRDFNAKLIDIAQANIMAGLNFVSELTRVKGPTEAIDVEARSKPAPKVDQQSLELATLGQRIASSSTEPLTRGFDQTFRRAL
jgi:hypothetical protein